MNPPLPVPPGWHLFHCIACARPIGVLPVFYWRHHGKPNRLPAFVAHRKCMEQTHPAFRMAMVVDAEILSETERRAQFN